MWEPRGHADMYGCLLVPPDAEGANVGVLFLHNSRYSTMCGHGIIAVNRVLLETGRLPMEAPSTTVRIDTPAGLVTAHATVEEEAVQHVSFENVPSFVVALDERVAVPGLGSIQYDLAFGGAFYAYVQADEADVECRPSEVDALVEKGMAIKHAIADSRPIEHPFEDDLGFLYGTIFIRPAEADDVHSRNVCVFAEGEVDRCPTGTGVSGRAAIHHQRGELRRNEPMVIESIIGSRFTTTISETTTFGSYQAIRPTVAGRTFITGRHTFVIDPDDPFGDGFLLR